jgi:regulator of cell morphogenesis and NO signaling
METIENTQADYNKLTVGKIVAKDYRKAKVFKKYGIDFCCGGNIKIEEAAKDVNADAGDIIEELLLIDAAISDDGVNYESWSTDQLIKHIVEVHHHYVSSTIEHLMPMVEKVARVHGHWRTELLDIEKTFKAIAEELTVHMHKEELILFPAILEMSNNCGVSNNQHFGTIQNPIRMMLMEHDSSGELMRKINQLTDNYTLPKGACATYTVMYKLLEEFENDLHTHIHLENNILFPRAIELEKNN